MRELLKENIRGAVQELMLWRAERYSKRTDLKQTFKSATERLKNKKNQRVLTSLYSYVKAKVDPSVRHEPKWSGSYKVLKSGECSLKINSRTTFFLFPPRGKNKVFFYFYFYFFDILHCVNTSLKKKRNNKLSQNVEADIQEWWMSWVCLVGNGGKQKKKASSS